MKLRCSKQHWVSAIAALLTVIGFCPRAFAPWNSIRANNHETERGGQVSRPTEQNWGHQAEVNRGREAEVNRGRGGEVNRGREAEVRRGEPERNFVRPAEIERENRERRHEDIDEDRRHAFSWFGYRPGMIISTLPPDYAPIYVDNTPYYYDQGVYYESNPSGYVVVNPPLGAIVPNLPPGAQAVAAGSTVYYYAGGAFYLPQPQGYMVVTPPPGLTVTQLPPNAAPVVINGVQYYQADGAYFLPQMEGGVTVYVTVRP